jgi:hypothetical protein
VIRLETEHGMTISDCGRHLVVERFADGGIGVWLADRGESDGPSVHLDEQERRRVAAFLLDGLP